MTAGSENLPQSRGAVLSLQVGVPRSLHTPDGKVWRSAINKEPVLGAAFVCENGVEGDRQADLKHHGGPDKAVCVYFASHFCEWNRRLGLTMGPAAFGENLTLDGPFSEEDLCIGDTLAVGSAVLQVSQPRMPCNNVARKWRMQEVPVEMERTGWTGFYCRVLEPGSIAAGDAISLTARFNPGWSLMRANHLLYGEGGDPDEIAALRDLPAFTGEWQRTLQRKWQRLTGRMG